MKTTYITTFIIFFLLSGILFGSEPEPKFKSKSIDNLEKHLNEKIIYPADAKSNKIEGFVLVSFTISSEGTIEVETINAENEELKAFIEKQLESIRLCPFDKSAGKTFNYKFVFKIS